MQMKGVRNMTSQQLVQSVFPHAYAGRFNAEERWYVGTEIGGWIMAIGATEDLAWRGAAESLGTLSPAARRSRTVFVVPKIV